MKKLKHFSKVPARRKFTRRDLIKWGLVSGTASLFHLGRLRADDLGPISPATTPFVQELPAPPEPNSVPQFSTPDCQPIINANTRFYKIIEEERMARFHPSLPLTSIWGYRDATRATWPFGPGPTFRARMNHGNIVRFTNNLPINHRGFGEPRTTVHLHDGRKPKELLARGPGVMKFIVEDEVPDPSQVPDNLRTVIPIPQSVLNSAVRRTLEFERRNGAWAINGQLVDLNKALVSAGESVPQIYRLVNKSGGWWHPIHFHLDFMRVLSRDGQLPPLDEREGFAKRDTVILRDNSVVEVFLRFTDYRGSYVFHCHNLEHEDMFMMGRLDVV